MGSEPSIFEVVLGDRIVIGYLRIGIVALALYILVSVPALMVARRWMKGLSTAGLTADDADEADQIIEELQTELKEAQDALQEQTTQSDLLGQLLLEIEPEIGDNPPEEGDTK